MQIKRIIFDSVINNKIYFSIISFLSILILFPSSPFGRRCRECIRATDEGFMAKIKIYDPKTINFARALRKNSTPQERKLWGFLKSSKFYGPVMILGRISNDEEKPVYKIAQIHPTVNLVLEFNLLDELLNKKYIGVLDLKRATTFIFENRKEEKHFPFEKISFAD